MLAFITSQRGGGDGRSLRAVHDAAGVSARTVRRRLSTIAGLFSYLTVRGDVMANPVPRAVTTRRELSRPRQAVPLVRRPRTLPRVLEAAEVDALLAAATTVRDRAMFQALVLGGLRRCEVLGLRGAGQVFIFRGKGMHQRQVPVSGRVSTSIGAYLDTERPAEASTGKLFVALKGPRRGQALSAAGVDTVMDGARGRAELVHATCHELRHTCLTGSREAGMALEAIQAQAGHASIESTRIYLHLGDDWLAAQYRRAAEVIDAQVFADHPHVPDRHTRTKPRG